MFDLICLLIFAVFFVVAILFVRGCERLEDEEN